jgi:Tfp pilus assembly protein PilN
MDRIDLDFISRRHRPNRLSWLLLAMGVALFSGALAWQQLDRLPKLSERQAQFKALRATLDLHRPQVARMDDKELAAEWSRAINVADELNQPWDKLFAVLEKDIKRPVALLSLEPDAAKSQLMLTAEAKNFDEMLAYYRYLQQQDMLKSVVLHAHQVNQQDRERPINFRITANWVVSP